MTAQLIAQTVWVVCPHCNETQPNRSNGSFLWTKEDFLVHEGDWKCVNCGKQILVLDQKKVKFQ